MTQSPADRGPETEVPHSARIWNYWLGGTDNYPVDRAAGDEYARVFAQFLDIGAGLPSSVPR